MLIALVVVVVLLLAFLAYVASKPGTFRVERSVVVAAPATRVFALVDDFRAWAEWSPFEGLDPGLQRSYSGAPNGVGAVYSYEGNSKVGAGRMEIRESVPASRIVSSLEFTRPMKAHNFAEFTFRPQGEATVVTWAIYGPSPFMSKLFSTFFSMDSIVGGQFEQGLANLKRVAEG